MPIDKNKEGAHTESRDESAGVRGPNETTQPSTTQAKAEPTRIGTKEDIRVGGKEGDGSPELRDNLRDGK